MTPQTEALIAESERLVARVCVYCCDIEANCDAGPHHPCRGFVQVQMQGHIRALTAALKEAKAEIERLLNINAQAEYDRQNSIEARGTYDAVNAENDTLRNEITALKQRLAEAEWQPIETAPKDGRAILGWPIFGHDGARECNWSPAWNGSWYVTNASASKQELTHWMPLPTAPNAGGDGGSGPPVPDSRANRKRY